MTYSLAVQQPIIFRLPSWKKIYSVGRMCLAVLLIMSTMAFTCNVAQWIGRAEQDLPIVLQIITNILAVAAPQFSPTVQATGAASLAGLQLLCGNVTSSAKVCDPNSLIGQYQAATDVSAKTSLLQKIDDALTVVQSHLQEILTAAHVANPAIQAAVTSAVTLALSTLLAIQLLIPVSSTPTATAVHVRGNRVSNVKAGTLNRDDIINQYNQAVSGTPIPAIH